MLHTLYYLYPSFVPTTLFWHFVLGFVLSFHMWLCSGAFFWTETQRKKAFKILNTKSEGGRGREGETETRTNSEKSRASATTRQSERGEHVGMSQLPAGGL